MSRKSQISPITDGVAAHNATLFVQHIPETTKNAFKAACATRKTTIRDAIIELMRKFVAETNK